MTLVFKFRVNEIYTITEAILNEHSLCYVVLLFTHVNLPTLSVALGYCFHTTCDFFKSFILVEMCDKPEISCI